MRIPELLLSGMRPWTVLGLLLVPVTAAAAPVPQPRALEAALRRLELTRVESDVPLSHDRFPLYFPVDRPYGRWQSADDRLSLSLYGHGHSSRRHQSISLELLFWNSGSFETGLARAERVMTTIGLPDEVRTTAAAMVRAARGRLETDRRRDQGWFEAHTLEAREAAGIQIRMRARFGGVGHVFLQFTDLRAPEVRWPTRDEVEQLHPFTHRRIMEVPSDVTMYETPIMLGIRCRPARPDAFRCRYVLDNRGRQPNPDGETWHGLFRRRADGQWTVQLDEPPPDRYNN